MKMTDNLGIDQKQQYYVFYGFYDFRQIPRHAYQSFLLPPSYTSKLASL